MAPDLIINGKVLQDVRLIIFDKDGTLMDVHTYCANIVRLRAVVITERLGLSSLQMLALMDCMGVDVPKIRIKPSGPAGIKRRASVVEAVLCYLESQRVSVRDGIIEDIFSKVDELSLSRLGEIVRPHDGLLSLIQQLKDAGCKIALATADTSSQAALCASELAIADSLDLIAGADMVENPKPAPDIIHFVCKRLGVPVAKSVMVGDAASDVLAGLNAACMAAIGVESGLTGKEELLALTPHVIPSISWIQVKQGR